MADKANSLAVFIDYENLALGTGPAPDMSLVLERLLDKGKILAKRAYSDWARFPDAVSSLHELGIELTEIPDRGMTGKNSADIRLVVDAMELSYTKEHIDTFVIVSGDSDFTPLVSALKENGRTVVGVGIKAATSNLLATNCDEFIYYDDLVSEIEAPAPVIDKSVPKKKQPAYRAVFDAIESLQRENVERMHSSLIKDTIRRKKPQFNESYYGYRSFTALLEEAQKLGYITMHKDARSGTWVVEGFTS